MHYMLDTDISSYIIRQHSKEALNKYQKMIDAYEDYVSISTISCSELIYGTLLKPSMHGIVQDFIDQIDVLPWDKKAAYHYADIRSYLKKNGTPVEVHDMQIAAHARSIGAALITNNEKHFEKVPGILIYNWAK